MHSIGMYRRCFHRLPIIRSNNIVSGEDKSTLHIIAIHQNPHLIQYMLELMNQRWISLSASCSSWSYHKGLSFFHLYFPNAILMYRWYLVDDTLFHRYNNQKYIVKPKQDIIIVFHWIIRSIENQLGFQHLLPHKFFLIWTLN